MRTKLALILLTLFSAACVHSELTLKDETNRSELEEAVRQINDVKGCEVVRIDSEGFIRVHYGDLSEYPGATARYENAEIILRADSNSSGTKLIRTIQHEIGHAFGLTHTDGSCDIMNAMDRGGCQYEDEALEAFVELLGDCP